MVVVTQPDRRGFRFPFRGAHSGVWIWVAAALARTAGSNRAAGANNRTPPARATIRRGCDLRRLLRQLIMAFAELMRQVASALPVTN